MLLPSVTLPRTYSPKNRLDLPGAGPIHRPLRSQITTSVCSLGKGSPLHSLSSRSRSWLQRPLTSSMYRIRAAFVEEFDLADEEWDCQLVSTSTVTVRKQVARIGHRATRDVRRTTEEQALREALQFRPRRGRRRLTLNASLRHDETALCSRSRRDPEHEVLTYVYSGSVVRFRSACCGRPDPTLRTRQSCARSKRRNGSPSVTRRVAESMRYGSDQVQGRHPYLVTRTSCCGLPFTPTSRKMKVPEAVTSTGILWVLRRRSPHLRFLRLRSPSLGCLERVAGPRTVGAYHSGHLL